MKVPDPLDAAVLDPEKLAKARAVMAAILVVVRASKQRRLAPEAVERQLDALTPQHYLWHWLAWKLGGFRRHVNLAVTADCKVVVIRPHELIYADPMTEEVARIPVGPSPDLPRAALTAPDLSRPLAPGSHYKVH